MRWVGQCVGTSSMGRIACTDVSDGLGSIQAHLKWVAEHEGTYHEGGIACRDMSEGWGRV